MNLTFAAPDHSPLGQIKRSDFGMSYALSGDLVGDEVDIILELEAIRQPA